MLQLSVLELRVGKHSEIMNSNQFVFQSTKFNIATRGQHVTRTGNAEHDIF